MGRDLRRMGMVERISKDIVQRFQQGRRQTELLRIGEAVLDGTATPAMRERQRFLEAQRTEDFGLEGFLEGAPGAAAEQLPILARTLTAGGVGAGLGATVGAATGAIAGKTPAATGTGARFGMMVGGGTAVAYDVAVMEASGAVLDYERLEGLDPETARGAALLAGALAGSLETLSLQQLAKVTPGLRDLGRSGVRSLLTNPSTRDLFLRVVKGIGLSAATEGATETLQSLITQGGGTIAEAAESGRLETDFAGVMAEVFGPEARAAAQAEGRAGAQAGLLLASVGGAGSFTQDVVRARRAERQAQAIERLAEAGGDAEATATAPREVADMVTALRQAGLSGFSYDAETWTAFFQSARDEQGATIDPAAVAAEVLGDATAYQTALQSGGTFEVPLGPWLTTLARNPAVRQWAVDHAKVGPGEMSRAEAATVAESTEQVLTELVDEMVTAKAEAQPVDEAAASLAERVTREVRAMGRPVREAMRAGELWSAVYRTWAETSGTSAADLSAMFARVRFGPYGQESVEAAKVVDAMLAEEARVEAAAPARTAEEQAAIDAENAEMFQAERAGMALDEDVGRDAVRTASGRLVANLQTVTSRALVAELARLYDTNATDTAALVALENDYGEVWTGTKDFKASGRQAARQKTIAKLESELARRGLDTNAALAEFHATEPADTSFDFGLNVDERFQAAFHGTPHIFDRFTTAKMGTGEGAQAFGWGLYFAENEGVAEGYRKTLAPEDKQKKIVEYLAQQAGTRNAEALYGLFRERREMGVSGFGSAYEDAARSIKSVDDMRVALERSEFSGALYRVDIRDEAVATFLDWDAEWNEMSPAVQKLLIDANLVDVEGGEPRIAGAEVLGGGAGATFDGRDLYKTLVAQWGEQYGPEALVNLDVADGQEAVSRFLLSLGIRGIKYLDRGSRAAGDGSRNLVVFDESDVTITHRNGEPVTAAERADVLEQASPEGPRGRIQFSAGRQQAIIELFAGADPSTFLHESAHLFLAFMEQLATRPNASDRIKADYAGVRAWLGAAEGAALTVEQEEQFARGFEAYLMEGKAPSSALRAAFAAFASWLTRLYRSIRGLNVELTDEVRHLFDRMLATDAAIQEAEDQSAVSAMEMMGDAVVPEAARATYVEALTDARLAATERLRTEVLSVIAREEQAWFKARRDALEPEVRAEVYADPAYRARAVFQTGKLPDGTALPEGDPLLGRLSKDGVVQLIGADGAKALPKPVMYRVDGGVHPDVAATAFGFPSGTALLAALQGTQPIEREIDARVDQRLRAEYGDPLTDGSLPARGLEAIHTAQRDRVIQLELEELQRRDPAAVRGLLRTFGGRIPVTADIMRQADAMLATRTLRSIRPIEFQRAEVKAAKAAIAAAVKGEWAEAAAQKVRERLSLALFRTATAALREVETQTDRFARYFRPDDVLAKTRDLNLVNAARATLARVGIGRAGKSPDEYLAAVRQYDAETAEDLDALIASPVPPREDSRDLTLAEFRQVTEQATGLWEQSKRTRQMVIDGQRVDRDVVVAALSAELVTMPDRMKGAGQSKAFTPGDTIRSKLIGMEAALRRVESWVDQMDGGAITGVFRTYLWTPISEASAAFRVAKRAVTERYLAILQQMPAARLTEGPFAAPEIGYTFRDRQELLGAMLHTGNLSNKDKLLRGRGWDPSQWEAMVARMQRAGILDATDYTFLQAVWDLFESLKPDAQAVHKEMLGYYFDEITAAPVVTPFGTFRGGYVPAMADAMLSEDARIRGEKAEQEGVNPATMFPSVQRGFTKRRVDEYARPLVMDLRLIRTHIDAVTRFIHLAQPTRDLGRLLLNRELRAAFFAVDPHIGSELMAWAQRAGQQVVETPSRGGGGKAVDTIFRWFRSNSGLNLMALNVTNTLQQFTGLSIAAVKVPPRYLRNALWQTVRAPKQMAAAIAERSPYMATRINAAAMEVERRIDVLVTSPTKVEQARAFAREHGYILQSTTQGLVDSVVWQGAYDWATANGADERVAVRQADAAVRLTQGSFAPEDVSRVETGTPFVRAFTMFYSYFNMQANLLRSEFAQAVKRGGLRKGSGRMLYVYTLGFLVPAVLSQMLVEAMAGGDEDDEDPELTEWMAVFFGSQVRAGFALVPGGNIVLTAGVNQFNDKWYDDRISVSPAVQTIESAGRAPKALYDWFAEGEVQRRDIRDVLTMLSITSGFPFVAASRPATYLFDVQQGTAEPSGPVDFTRGLVSGKP